MSSSALASPSLSDRLRTSPFQAWVRRRLHAALGALAEGSLALREAGALSRYGQADGHDGLRSTVTVRDPDFYSSLGLGGTLGAAESFVRGEWEADDLTALFRILIRNERVMAGLDRRLARLTEPGHRLVHWLRRNTRRRARRNIAAHYDLGNEFFAAFLDPTLSYSAALFEREDATLEEASIAKYERICRKLEVGPEDHILEIGTGWGGFCLHAAGRHGCRVTSTTLSAAQRELALERVSAAGLSERVQVLGEDYRDLEGCFDKLVSIEMVEAVGHEHLRDYFRACAERLVPTGRAAFQAIVIRDQAHESARRTVDFIKRYVFPGGCLPSLGALVDAASRSSDLRLVHLEELTPHYAETLRRWRARFRENLDRIRALGLGDSAVRLWEYYLAYCEAGFEERHIGVVQLVFERAACRARPIVGALPARAAPAS
jgi:cyclopropane-fatty-acyl-phospholipid synthase